ncbi:MAG: tetratricopeptide repeat-containing sensor histidine kinase [Chitinophagaceae bacterium]
MKYWLLLLLLVKSYTCSFAQTDTAYLKGLYDRSLDFSEDKMDSVMYYAKLIKREADRLHFDKGDVLSLRLKGIYEELAGNYEKAIEYYLHSLDAARKLPNREYESSALSDLAIAYANIKEPLKAKDFYLQSAAVAKGQEHIHELINTYNNLGVIYIQLGQYDSARTLLNEALKLAKPYGGRLDLSSEYNNLGNINFHEKKYDEALSFFKKNYDTYQKDNITHDLWIATLNIADVFIEKHQFDSAEIYAKEAMAMAKDHFESKSKEADSYSILAKLYERKGNYSKAYQYLKSWYTLDTALVNADTYRSIAELQESYNAKDREAQNKLLQGKIEREELRRQGMTLLAISLSVILVLIAAAFLIKRNANMRLQATNTQILQQNEKLAELNYEKNSLISIVSHDLNTPFATIQIWGQVLESDGKGMTEEQRKALDKILQASYYGEELIQRILNIERADIGTHKMYLENFDLTILGEEMADKFKPAAGKKELQLNVEMPRKKIVLMSDKQLVGRICENLLSNAIKYTPRQRNIWFSINEEHDAVSIKVRDEGVGIPKEELPHLFSRYSKISSQPTDGEGSNGLGLSIVKRIVEEINGQIFCESEEGEGSLFTVILKK